MSFAGARAALSPDNSLAMALWSLQIALNTLWTPVFFGLKNLKLGLIVLIALWVSVATTMLALWQVDWFSGVLFSLSYVGYCRGSTECRCLENEHGRGKNIKLVMQANSFS